MNFSNNKTVKKAKLPIINERFLTVVLKVLGSKTDITQQELNNVLKLLNRIDKNYYEGYDTTLGALLKAIDITASFKLKNREINDDINDCLLIEIQNELASSYYTETLNNVIIPLLTDVKNKKFDYDAKFINEEIHTYLQFGKIMSHRDDFITVSNNISTSSGQELRDELYKFQTMLNQFAEFYREIDIENLQNTVIHSSENNFFTDLKESYTNSKSPTYVLKTGLQLFNKCLSERGGLVPGYYLFYANINSFKSGLLEHFVKWIYVYNSDTFRRIKKKTGKKPLLLYGSFENSKQDDYERFTKIYTNNDLQSFNTFNDVQNAWESSIEELSGISFQELNDLIDIAYYYPVNQVRVSDLRKLITQLEEQNYKVIAVVLDYLEKIKPEIEDSKLDSKYMLGGISENLHELQKQLECPLITAHQINREGARALYDNKDSGKMNAMTALNSTYIGKDWDIDKPSSFSGFIDIEKDPNSDAKYLTFKKGKQRGKRTSIETWVHELKDGLILEDDIKLAKPTSKLALTAENDNEIAYHVSNSVKTNGNRGRTVLNMDGKPHIKQDKNNNSINLKDTIKELLTEMSVGIVKNIIIKCSESIGMNERFDNDRILIDKNNKTYIRCQSFTMKDRMSL